MEEPMIRLIKNRIKLFFRVTIKIPILFFIYFISGFLPRKAHVWVFGAWEGIYWNDNAKYLYLYLLEKFPEITAVWVTRSDKIFQQLKSDGLPVAHCDRFSGWRVCAIARCIFVTHGRVDVNPWLIRGAHIYYLNHAPYPLKKMGLDHTCIMTPLDRVKSFFQYPMQTFGYSKIFTTSLPSRLRVVSSLGVSENKVIVSGLPRHDFLIDQKRIVQKNGADAHQGVPYQSISYRNLIFFAPTFRELASFNWFDFSFDYWVLESFLNDTSSILIMSFHPFEAERYIKKFQPAPRIFFDSSADAYPLLPHTSILITDYSSIAFDFLLFDRPIIFSNFDHEQYVNNRGLYEDYDSVTPGFKARNWPEVLERLETLILHKNDPHTNERAALCSRVYEYSDSGSSARIIKHVQRDIRKLTSAVDV